MTSWWISDRAELKLQMEQLGRLLQAKNEWLSHYSLSQGWPWIQKWGEIFSMGRDLANAPDNLPCTKREAARSKKMYRLIGKWPGWLVRVQKGERLDDWGWTSLVVQWLRIHLPITDKNLLYSTWNSAQCYGRWGLGGEWIHVYVWLSSFTVHLKLLQHCLLISYNPVQNKKKKKKKKNLPARAGDMALIPWRSTRKIPQASEQLSPHATITDAHAP